MKKNNPEWVQHLLFVFVLNWKPRRQASRHDLTRYSRLVHTLHSHCLQVKTFKQQQDKAQ